MWVFDADAPALVLGSTQRLDDVDIAACARARVAVVHRRSGGGAVLIEPGEATWVDLLLPRADALWDDDVGHAAQWVGDAWEHALVAAGAPAGTVTVHRGGLIRGAWSDAVCFAGLGPGELTVGDAKLVGISQRRTRSGARFQCVLLHRWRPDRLIGLLAPPRPTVDELVPMATDTATLGLDPGRVVDALLARLVSI